MQASHLWCLLVDKVTNLRITNSEPLPSPVELCEEIPRSSEQNSVVRKSRETLHSLIEGKDKRLLAVVGPCSIHELTGCREYAERFAKLADELKDRLELVMRVYFEKPRTTVGWKGLIMDPKLNGTCDIPEGLRIAENFWVRFWIWESRLQLNCWIRSLLNILQILYAGLRLVPGPPNPRLIVRWHRGYPCR